MTQADFHFLIIVWLLASICWSIARSNKRKDKDDK